MTSLNIEHYDMTAANASNVVQWMGICKWKKRKPIIIMPCVYFMHEVEGWTDGSFDG